MTITLPATLATAPDPDRADQAVKRYGHCPWCLDMSVGLTTAGLVATHMADGVVCPGSGLTDWLATS